jgi:hypothetical protein
MVSMMRWLDGQRFHQRLRPKHLTALGMVVGQLDLFVATQFATMVLWASAFLKDDPMRTSEYELWRDDNGRKLIGYIQR